MTVGDYTGAAVNGDPIELSIASQSAGPAATLMCSVNPVTPTSGGAAAFSGCVIEGPTATYTLSATDTSDGLVVATSSPFAITAGPATQLAFVQQPTATTAGSAVAPAVSVAIEDAFGNVETSDDSTEVGLVLGGESRGPGTLSGGSPVVVSAGVATFSTLSIDNPGNGYTLVVGAGLLAPATSSAFNVVGPATQVVFVQGPTDATAGSTITPPVTVAVEDANGNVETADNSTQVTLAVGTNPNHGTLNGGAATTVVDWVATFSGLSIDAAGTGYTLVATDGTYASATSSTFDITPGSATQLAFVQQPTNTAAGSSITPAVTVAVEDAYGNVETVDNSTKVTLALGANPGSGTLNGGAATTVVNGVATFSGLSLDVAGNSHTLTATDTTDTSGTSSSFDITAGPSTQLAFVQEPTGAGAGSAIAPSVTVATEDQYGNVETSDNSTQVTLTLGTDPGNGPLAGGATTVVAGVATFSGLTLDKIGTGYTLMANDSTDTGATSSPFAITAGPATQLAFVQQPTATTAGSAVAPAVSVAIEDAFGNVETSDDSTEVGLVLGANPATGTLSGGSPVVVSAGVATFSTLSIDNPGNGYTLVVGAGLLAPATSSAFNVVGPATQVVFVQGPTDATAGSTITPPVTVAVEDANGNVETADNSTQVTLAVGTNPNHGTLNGGAATTVVDGVATFSGLSIDAAGTGYTLVATDGTYASATSSTFDITPGSATQLAFVQQPTNTAAGSSITPAVTVAVEDAYGNVETVDNSTKVTLALGANPEAGR